MTFDSRRIFRSAAALTVGASLLFTTACAASGEDSDEDTFTIVASTSIWADVAEAVAGEAENVEIEPIVTGNDVDPHHFEPTAADIARANEADLLLVNGGGYDAWIYQAVSDQDNIVSALPLVDHGALDEEADVVSNAEASQPENQDHVTNIEGNEHIWYDVAALEQVGKDVAEAINAADPEANTSEQPLLDKVEGFQERLGDLPELNYAQTEPIADYLFKYAPATDVTPEGYRKTTVSEGEPSAADLARFLQTLDDDAVDLLIYNPQTETDLTARIRDAAEEDGVQIVEIGETPPEDSNFFDYYEQVLSELEAVEA